MRRSAALLVALALVGGCGTPEGAAGAGCEEGIVETDSGLEYEDVVCGDGAEAKNGDSVAVHYTGKLEDGTEFESSEGGDPFEFVLGAGFVIAGWDEGVQGMREGGTRNLTIPPELGYGEGGYPPTIPGNAVLLFEVRLVEVNAAPPSPEG